MVADLKLVTQNEPVDFTPARETGLKRLDMFVARMGHQYSSRRNFDYGPRCRDNVSILSPWIRHRAITEEEVLQAALSSHPPFAAAKFIEEIFWRTYFKGWLEHHPSVWSTYLSDLLRIFSDLEKDNSLTLLYKDAISGRTDIECFNHWALELVETGYLHNHARMWFASIWIFTLRLPWQLGADFFLRHLLDGDPASNTLGWRWVAGLHTKGKIYLARRDNIEKYTNGLFCPSGLSNNAIPIVEEIKHKSRPIPPGHPFPGGDFLLALTQEDCRVEEIVPFAPKAVIGLVNSGRGSPLPIGRHAARFSEGIVIDTLYRNSGTKANLVYWSKDFAEALISIASAENVATIVTGNTPVGPIASILEEIRPLLNKAGIQLYQIKRNYDEICWPFTKSGFFSLKRKIPEILSCLSLIA